MSIYAYFVKHQIYMRFKLRKYTLKFKIHIRSLLIQEEDNFIDQY